MNPTLICMSLVAGLCLGASLDKPEEGGAAGEAAEGDAGIDADAVKLLESDEIQEVAELTNSWLNQPSYPEKKPAKANKTECGFIPDYFCNPTADDHIQKVDDKNVTTAEACNEKCLKQDNCTVFTYFKFRGFASCHLLRSCKEKKPRCTVTGTCVSGRKNCTETPKPQPTGVPCPKLKLTPGYNSHWRCEGVNPYKDDIPSQVTCHTSCPLWKNKAGKMVTAMSTCQFDGTWSETIPLPPGPLAHPKVLNKPDGPDMKCDGCKPLNMTYNPNMEKGAAFHCNPPIDWDNLPAKIEGTAHCNLLCDNMLVASMDCHNLKWTGKPDLGFWCAEEKPPVNYWVESKENKYTKDKETEKKTDKHTEKDTKKDKDTEKNAANEAYGEDKNSKTSKTKYTKGESMDYKMNLNDDMDMDTEKDIDSEADTDKTSKIADTTKTSKKITKNDDKNKKKEQDILDYLDNEIKEDKKNKKKSGDLDKEEDIKGEADKSSKTSKTTKTAKKINKDIEKSTDKKMKEEQEILDEIDNELEDKNKESKMDEVKNSKPSKNSKTSKTKDKKIETDKDMDMDEDIEEDKDTEKDHKMAKDTDKDNASKTSKKTENSDKKSKDSTTKTSKKALNNEKSLDELELEEVLKEAENLDKNKKKRKS